MNNNTGLKDKLLEEIIEYAKKYQVENFICKYSLIYRSYSVVAILEVVLKVYPFGRIPNYKLF